MATASARSRQPMPLIKAARLWRDDPDNDRNQRELAEAVDALDPAVDTDEVSRLFAMFDAFAASTVHASLTVHDREDELVLYAFNLWCSARNANVVREVYEAHGMRWIGHTAALADGVELHLIGRHVNIAPVAEVTPLAVRAALRDPHWSDDEASSLDGDGSDVVATEVAR